MKELLVMDEQETIETRLIHSQKNFPRKIPRKMPILKIETVYLFFALSIVFYFKSKGALI